MVKKLISETIVPESLYIERSADRQIEKVVQDMGRPGYILVSRQMGKTNLLIHTKNKLETPDDIFAYIDLSNRFSTDRECFRNIVDTIIQSNYEKLESIEEHIENRRETRKLPSHKEHSYEMRKILNSISGKLIVNLDEIDSLTMADYSDKIFAHIRSVYFERVNFKELKRLTYILSGVAEPSDIIKDKSISPFNIGQKIFLDDFNYNEFLSFVNKSELNLSQPVNERLFYWINGNPRISWEVLSLIEDVIEDGKKEINEKLVDEIINQLYLLEFNHPPVDHIRSLVSDDKDFQNAVISLHYGKPISDAMRSKLYLAGITSSLESNETVSFKNKIIENSLSEKWINSLSNHENISLERANKAFIDQKYKLAEKQYLELVKQEDRPTYKCDIYHRLAACSMYLNKYSDAVSFCNLYKKENKESKFNSEISWILGYCYLRLNEIDKSKPELEKVLESGEENMIKFRSCVDLSLALMKNSKNKVRVIELCNLAISNVTLGIENETSSDVIVGKKEIIYLANMILATVDKEKSVNHIHEALKYSLGTDKIVASILYYEKIKDKEWLWENLFESILLNLSQCFNGFATEPFKIKNTHIQFILNYSHEVSDEQFSKYLQGIKSLLSLDHSENDELEVLPNLIYCIALSKGDDDKANRWIDILNYINSLERDIVNPEMDFQTNKYLSYLDSNNESAKEVYFQGVQNYISTPDIMDEEIFENEIIKLNKSGDYEKSISLADLILGLDVLSSTTTKRTLIRIMYLKMIFVKDVDKKLSLAREIGQILDTINKENIGHSRMNFKDIDHIKKNTNSIIILNTPIEQVVNEKKYGRNERILVEYIDGDVRKSGKYKNFESDIISGKCKVLD